jgi:hypothetical protein
MAVMSLYNISEETLRKTLYVKNQNNAIVIDAISEILVS